MLTATTFKDKIRALSASTEHNLLAIGDANLEIYNMTSNEFLSYKRLNDNHQMGSIYSLQMNQHNDDRNTTLLVGRHDGSIQLFDFSTMTYVHTTPKAHSNTVKCFTKCENHVFYSGSYDMSIQMWDDRKLSQSVKSSVKHSGYVNSLCVYNEHVYSTSVDGISIFDKNLKFMTKCKQKTEVLSSCHDVLSSGTPSHLYFSCKDGSVRIFDMNCNQMIYTLCESSNISVNSMDCNTSTMRLYACNNQGQVQEFDTENLYLVQTLETKSAQDKKNMDSSIRSSCMYGTDLLILGTQGRNVKTISL